MAPFSIKNMGLLSKSSLHKLSHADERLEKLFLELSREHNFYVTCSYRSKEEQDEAFDNGRSKVKYPNSKHNAIPALAVDAMPFKNNGIIDWSDKILIMDFARAVKEKAAQLGIEIISGALDWKRFFDGPHYELSDAEIQKGIKK